LKSGSLPAKADPEKQRRFWEAVLRPLMRRARQGKITLLFADASHFVMGGDFLGYIYGRARRFVRTFSGRKRYNILGSLDYVSKKLTSVANITYITAAEVCQLLKKISEEYPNKPVFVILDNARYQKCEIVRALAKELNIHLVFIPPYSPNLNLVERVWKFAKSGLRSQYYREFKVFCERIDSIIESTHADNFDALDRLIGRGVQLFDDLVPAAENSFCKYNLAA
jgi:transposase